MTDSTQIRYDWARVECPSCHAGPDTRCRALTSGRSTDAHQRRIQMGNRWRYEMRLGG